MSMDAERVKDPRDKWIPIYFVMFFVVVACLDSIFVYIAVSTQTGVVTERPYEKGLAYNETLNKAKSQPDIKQSVTYQNGLLRWALADKDGKPLDNVRVRASIIRAVHDGYDFDIVLAHMGGGIYEAIPDLPMNGLWRAKLSGTWDNKQYQTTHEFIAQ